MQSPILTPAQKADEASRRLTEINQLRSCPAWSSYWIPAIRALKEKSEHEVLENDALAPDVREQKRKIARAYGELLTKADKDAAGYERDIAAANKRPQVGVGAHN